jgi:hypothetical protein
MMQLSAMLRRNIFASLTSDSCDPDDVGAGPVHRANGYSLVCESRTL